MVHITLALPLALPPAELAPDLQRAMKTPALAMLLSRAGAERIVRGEDGPVLAHEAWLARAAGLPSASNHGETSAPLAVAVMRGYGLAPAEGHWFMVQPIHVQMARTHLTMADPRNLALADADARALFELARPYFEETGRTLLYGDATTWFVRADDWAGVQTCSPDAATGMNLSDWVPSGANALALRKLQNEIQMLWHEHPVNEARQARGLVPVNSIWPWAGAAANAADAATPAQTPALSVAGAPAWMTALSSPAALRDAPLPAVLAHGAPRITAVRADLIQSASAGEWSSWLLEMQRLEQEYFAPLLAALKDGRVAQLTLVLSHRSVLAEFDIGKSSLRKFWRKPTLSKLTT